MFSIGVPAFKGLNLKECIDSILNQSYKDFELIIVNDCSPDPLDDIIDQYDDSRIQYYKNERNFGAEHVVDNWNKCLSLASKDYFILMGDDDKMEQDFLQEFVNLINLYPKLDVFHCRSIIIDKSSLPISITPINPSYEDVYDYMINCLEGRRQQFVSDFVYRTNVLKHNGGYYKLPMGWCSDYLTSFVLANNKGIAHTNKPIFNYRSHSDSITSTGNVERKGEAVSKYINWIEEFLEVKEDDKVLLLKQNILRNTLDKFIIRERQDKIRSSNGKGNMIKSIMRYLHLRKEQKLSLNDLIGSIAASVYFRTLRK